jgi:hypothetical protein
VPAVTWAVALVVDPGPFTGAHSVLLICLGLLACAATSVVGMVVVAGRWAHRLGWSVVGLTAILAVARPVDLTWVLGLTSSVVAGVALVAVASRMRKLASATGPPDRAVVLTLVLLGAPAIVGLGAPEPAWAALGVGLTALLSAFLYSRVIFGGLITVRIVWPLLALGISPLMTMPGAVTSIALGALVASIAWHPSVKVAFHPPREVGSTFPIPPELAPREVLDTAQIDDTGRQL